MSELDINNNDQIEEVSEGAAEESVMLENSDFADKTDAGDAADIASGTTETEKITVPAEKAPLPKKPPFVAELVDYVEILVFAICFVILLYSFGVRLCVVNGASMEDTLIENEKLIVSNVFYTPERGDIIVFHQTGKNLNEPVVKRVIATAGETVDIKYKTDGRNVTGMTVTVTKSDGSIEVLEETYTKYDTNHSPAVSYLNYPVTVPEGKIFVMGDNRNNSWDSRGYEIGFVDTRRVLGRVLLRLTPLNKFGMVK